MKKIILALSVPIIIIASEYKIPPKAIADIVDAPLTPTMSLSPNKIGAFCSRVATCWCAHKSRHER